MTSMDAMRRTAGILKQLKGEMSADLTAFKKGLDRNTNHHDLTKAETEEIFVLTKAIGEKEIVALKLEQSAKEVAQRPPPWRDKCNRGREFGVAGTSCLETSSCLLYTIPVQMNWNVMVSSRNRKQVSRS